MSDTAVQARLTGKQPDLTAVSDRFWTKVRVAGMLDCWEYQGARDRGYGEFGVGTSGKISAHRLAWLLERGSIPDGLVVCHHCDNPPCCNPFHLFVGTQGDNMRDMVAKGRSSRRRDRRGRWTA